MIESYGTLEQDFRLAQKKIDNYKQVYQSVNIVEVFADLSEVTPEDIEIAQLGILPTSVVITGSTISQTAFNLLINNLQLSPDFRNVTVGKVESKDDETPGFEFNVRADTRLVEMKQTQQEAAPERVDVLDRTQGL